MTLELTEKERITLISEYCKDEILILENMPVIPGSAKYYCNQIIQDHLRDILELLTLTESE